MAEGGILIMQPDSFLAIKLFYHESLLKKMFFKRNINEIFDASFRIDELLDNLDIEQGSTLFLHVGLRKLKQKANKECGQIADQIINTLSKRYKPCSIIVPAFTPSYRTTGLFSINHSKSEAGAFSELFRQKANYRTPDPIHSVSIITEDINKFKNLDYGNTFSKNGIFEYLRNLNSYILNISTNDFVSFQLHYIEEIHQVPYKSRTNNVFSGCIFDYRDSPILRTQVNHAYKVSTAFNRDKIAGYLKAEGVLKEKCYKNIEISCIKIHALHEALEKKLTKNKNFLVTF
jgi:aminoglycoside N3'-acetyltransferase